MRFTTSSSSLAGAFSLPRWDAGLAEGVVRSMTLPSSSPPWPWSCGVGVLTFPLGVLGGGARATCFPLSNCAGGGHTGWRARGRGSGLIGFLSRSSSPLGAGTGGIS